MNYSSAIKNYILFLKDRHNLSISIHPQKFDNYTIAQNLWAFNIHENSYCAFIKTNPQAYKHCMASQRKVFNKCKNGSFCGVCHAGVKEYVYPITVEGETVGFISVSGYKTENATEYLNKISQKYSLNARLVKNNYSTLKETLNTKDYFDTLILPLCAMLELEYIKSKDNQVNDNSIAISVQNYIKQYRHQNITSKEICEHFSCSRSYMSTEFNKYTGKTIREYLTELRLKDAKSLLTHSNLNITEIAYSVGFTDANYFSNTFKKANGISPIKYRKATQK